MRTVDAINIDGVFYTITHNSTKVKQIESYAENMFGKTINAFFYVNLSFIYTQIFPSVQS